MAFELIWKLVARANAKNVDIDWLWFFTNIDFPCRFCSADIHAALIILNNIYGSLSLWDTETVAKMFHIC